MYNYGVILKFINYFIYVKWNSFFTERGFTRSFVEYSNNHPPKGFDYLVDVRSFGNRIISCLLCKPGKERQLCINLC